MKISYNWLKELLPVDLPVADAASILTNTGLEVEGVDAFVSIEGGLEGLVVGEVIEKWKHPNADRLSVTKVNVGGDEPLQIVCGAPNVDSGQKVVVATVGTKLYPSEGDPFEIKKGKIRGEVSMGMICAEDEIGLGASHDGIMVLNADAQVGMAATDYFGIYRDHTIEIGLTPNRTDAMSHIGVARDLRVALLHAEDLQDHQAPSLVFPESKASASNSTPVEIDIQAPEACPRYAGLVLSNIKVAPSPEWLQNKLKAIDLEPINNIVDITNFVLHEFGHPLHAFDLSKVKGNKVVVRLAKEGEKFVTLDGKERALLNSDLMICNESDPMCIAGVFGGEESGISDATTDVFLESAVFDPVYVRKTSKHHLLHTDAAYRFERGVDPETTIPAMMRAASLMVEIAGATIASAVNDVYPKAIERMAISVSLSRMNSLIGKDIPKEKVVAILKDLDFEITADADDSIDLLAPLYRRDVTREADVVEEVLRIYGYNNIEMPSRLSSTLSSAPKPNPEKWMHKIADMLVARGFQETMSNSLTKSSYSELLDSPELQGDTAVRMKNPLSSDLGQLRQTLLFQGLEVIGRNINHKRADLRLFEFGRTYHHYNGEMVETPYLGMWLTGLGTPENWTNDSAKGTFTSLRGGLESVFARFGLLSDIKEKPYEHPKYAEALQFGTKKKVLGTAGLVSSKLLKAFDIDQPVYYAELNWNELIALEQKSQVVFQEPEKFPAVRRDLSLLIDKATSFGDIRNAAFQVERKFLREVGLFDVYEGKNLPQNKQSYAVSFILQDKEATMTDKKIDKIMSKIQQTLEKEFGAELRS